MAGFGSIFKEQLSHGSVLAVCRATKPCYYIEIVLTFIYVALGFFFFFKAFNGVFTPIAYFLGWEGALGACPF